MMSSCKSQNNSLDSKIMIGNPDISIAKEDTLNKLGNNIMTVYQDKKNNYWFGSWQDGLYKYDGKILNHYTMENGLPHNRVEDIQEDKWGNIYFNTSKGLCKFDGHEFIKLHPEEFASWRLQSDDLWFKSLQFDGAVYRYDGKVLHKLQFPKFNPGKEWIDKYPGFSTSTAIYTIYKDKKNNIWFGTASLGACRYDGTSFEWISEEDVTELHDKPANGVRSIIEDKDGYFWFNSAYRYRIYGNDLPIKDSFYIREKSIGNLDGNQFSDFWEYMSIARDNNDDLWIATYANGVWRYDGKRTSYYPVQDEGKDITLFSIYKDKHGDLWLGTHEHGAYKFNGRTFERFRP